jgi:TRAP-type mannitol/chloroaromatic compound transport system permease small subunit
MQRVLLGIDALSTWVGKTFAWSILLLTLSISYEVFMRYVFRAPTTWSYDVGYILYGTLFMMAGAYTLSRNGHVRGDFLYRTWPPRVQAGLDLVLYALFFFPGMIAFVYAGWGYFWLSYIANEHSIFTPAGPPIWPFKGLIPIVGVLMILQGVAEVIRSIYTVRTGQFPQRLHDVEQLENEILAEFQHTQEPGDAR